jgi:hypothetical protein
VGGSAHNTLDIEIDLGLGSDLLLVTKPGIVVETDNLTVRRGDVKIRPTTDQVPVTLTILVTGQIRGGDVVARFPRRTFNQWLRRDPPPYQSLTS